MSAINNSSKSDDFTTNFQENVRETKATGIVIPRPQEEALHDLLGKALELKDEAPLISLRQKEVEVQSVETLFAGNALLVRAVGEDEVFEDLADAPKPKLGTLRQEANYLTSEEGLKNTSSTLLVPDKPVSMYKGIGLLFNGNTCVIQHIYGIDSNSNVSGEGKLSAGGQEKLTFHSLDALASAIKTTNLLDKSRMNEVNGVFKTNDLVGLTTRTLKNMTNNAVLNLKIRSIQKLILNNYQIDLPIYKYDEDKGTLVKLPNHRTEIEKELIDGKNDPVLKGNIGKMQKFLLD